MAATIDEISGGRLVLGLGAGWNETEYRAFGYPFDHRIGRFEEAFTIIRTLLREGAIDFDGRWYQARDCELLPRGPRPAGPPLMIGSSGPRMLAGHDGPCRLVECVVPRHREPAGRRPADACPGRRGLRRGRSRSGRGRADGRGPGPARRAAPAGCRATSPRAASPRSTASPRSWQRRCGRSRGRGSPMSSSCRPDHRRIDRGARPGAGRSRPWRMRPSGGTTQTAC